jgi:hypothetical protein
MRFAGATGALAVLAASFVVGAASAPESVTLNVGKYRNANGVLVTVFSGTVSSDAANEVVDVLGQSCGGGTGFRLISGTHTRPGGSWRVENPLQEFPWTSTPAGPPITYRARWSDQLSAPYFDTVPAPLFFRKVGRRAWRVYTSPPHPGKIKMRGKPVELQRLTGGAWRTIQRKPLVFRPRYAEFGGAYNHEALFKVARSGWRLRAFLPARSAAPCYLAGATQEWRS